MITEGPQFEPESARFLGSSLGLHMLLVMLDFFLRSAALLPHNFTATTVARGEKHDVPQGRVSWGSIFVDSRWNSPTSSQL